MILMLSLSGREGLTDTSYPNFVEKPSDTGTLTVRQVISRWHRILLYSLPASYGEITLLKSKMGARVLLCVRKESRIRPSMTILTSALSVWVCSVLHSLLFFGQWLQFWNLIWF